jgi:hypothetical protein
MPCTVLDFIILFLARAWLYRARVGRPSIGTQNGQIGLLKKRVSQPGELLCASVPVPP